MKDENNKNHLIINPEEAPIVKKIFQMYNSGNSMGEIAEKLQKDKVYCPSHNGFQKNKKGEYGWERSTISKMLKNEMYLGNNELVDKAINEYGKKIKEKLGV